MRYLFTILILISGFKSTAQIIRANENHELINCEDSTLNNPDLIICAYYPFDQSKKIMDSLETCILNKIDSLILEDKEYNKDNPAEPMKEQLENHMNMKTLFINSQKSFKSFAENEAKFYGAFHNGRLISVYECGEEESIIDERIKGLLDYLNDELSAE